MVKFFRVDLMIKIVLQRKLKLVVKILKNVIDEKLTLHSSNFFQMTKDEIVADEIIYSL